MSVDLATEQTGESLAADLARFARLVDTLDRYIRESLAEDGHCKPYEGSWRLNMPSYFERTTAPDTPWLWVRDGWSIELDCYLIGPHRHYEWNAPTLSEALAMAEAEVTRWIAEAREESRS